MFTLVNMSTRASIGRAAKKLFARQGAQAVTMRSVARRVGISPTAIYRHYRNKDALLDELIRTGFEVLEAYLHPGLAEATPELRLRGMLRRYLDFGLEQGHFAVLMFQTPRPKLRRFPEDFRQRRSVVFARFADEVEACMRDGSFRRDDVLEVTLSLWAQVHGLMSLHRLGRFGDDELRFRGIYERALERTLRGLRA